MAPFSAAGGGDCGTRDLFQLLRSLSASLVSILRSFVLAFLDFFFSAEAAIFSLFRWRPSYLLSILLYLGFGLARLLLHRPGDTLLLTLLGCALVGSTLLLLYLGSELLGNTLLFLLGLTLRGSELLLLLNIELFGLAFLSSTLLLLSLLLLLRVVDVA